MKNFISGAVAFGAVVGAMGLAASASANHGSSATTVNGGKDSGRVEVVEKGDGGHFELNAIEKGDGGHFDLNAIEKGDGGHVALSTFEKKDGG